MTSTRVVRVRRRRAFSAIVSVFVLTASAAFAMPVVADPGDIGVEGTSFNGVSGSPTAEKPESKLWFNDGTWWGSLWDPSSSRHEIHRLDVATQTWSSTNVPLDARSNSRADTLWDGSKLYVASHVLSTSPANGYPSYLYRFSYQISTKTYSLDSGFPQQINNARSESLVIDKDSTGKLWATWVQSSKVYVNRTTNGDLNWGTPFVLPGPTAHTSVNSDDLSSVIAFDGNKIGVFWSNQNGSSFHFAVHDDGAPDTSWGSSVGVYAGSGNADDHVNLRSLHTDGSGRVFAAVKTSRSGSSSPSIVLLVRSKSALWTDYTIWTRGDGLTRPIVMLDTSSNRVMAFASKESGGRVHMKTSSLSALGFSSGLGETVMYDASHNDINNATSTKQNVSSGTGLVVLAGNDTTKRYWHHHDPLGGAGPTPTPTPTTTPTSSAAPTPTPGSGTTVTVNAAADAHVVSGNATKNYGSISSLQLREADNNSQTYRAYLRFEAGGSGTPASAVLRLFISDVSSNHGRVLLVSNSWTESGITWSNAPAIIGAPELATFVPSSTGWLDIPLDASKLPSGGTYSLAVLNGGTNSTKFDSREGSNAPQLVMQTSGGSATPAPTPTPTPSTTSTPTPTPTATPTTTPTSSAAPTPTPGSGTTVTVNAAADAHVVSGNATKNYGSISSLQLREPTDGSQTYRAYLRFEAGGSGTPASAVLRLFISDVSSNHGRVLLVSNSWTESGITWSNAPAIIGAPELATFVPSSTGWLDIPLDASKLPSGGTYSLAVLNGGTNSTLFDSREGSNAPRLVMQGS